MEKHVEEELRRELEAWKTSYGKVRDLNLRIAEIDAERAAVVDALDSEIAEMDRVHGVVNALLEDENVEDDDSIVAIVGDVLGSVMLMELVG